MEADVGEDGTAVGELLPVKVRLKVSEILMRGMSLEVGEYSADKQNQDIKLVDLEKASYGCIDAREDLEDPDAALSGPALPAASHDQQGHNPQATTGPGKMKDAPVHPNYSEENKEAGCTPQSELSGDTTLSDTESQSFCKVTSINYRVYKIWKGKNAEQFDLKHDNANSSFEVILGSKMTRSRGFFTKNNTNMSGSHGEARHEQ
jgi:hypothetical protein